MNKKILIGVGITGVIAVGTYAFIVNKNKKTQTNTGSQNTNTETPPIANSGGVSQIDLKCDFKKIFGIKC